MDCDQKQKQSNQTDTQQTGSKQAESEGVYGKQDTGKPNDAQFTENEALVKSTAVYLDMKRELQKTDAAIEIHQAAIKEKLAKAMMILAEVRSKLDAVERDEKECLDAYREALEAREAGLDLESEWSTDEEDQDLTDEDLGDEDLEDEDLGDEYEADDEDEDEDGGVALDMEVLAESLHECSSSPSDDTEPTEDADSDEDSDSSLESNRTRGDGVKV
ncbi:hypothetical protein ACHAPT_011736 [Fusarium lateritium]